MGSRFNDQPVHEILGKPPHGLWTSGPGVAGLPAAAVANRLVGLWVWLGVPGLGKKSPNPGSDDVRVVDVQPRHRGAVHQRHHAGQQGHQRGQVPAMLARQNRPAHPQFF